jgi:dienelactone hydrolase
VGNRTNPRATIVMFSDVFCLELPNNKLIADAYAKSGEYLVYLPDFSLGDPAPLSLADIAIPVDLSKVGVFSKYTGILMALPSYIGWKMRHPEAHTTKTCNDFLATLRKETPNGRKIGMVGFCWGGKYAIRAGLASSMISLSDTENPGDDKKVPLVDAIVGLHPSQLVIPDDVENLVVPVSIGWGEEDRGVKIEQMDRIKAVHKTAADAGKVVPEMEHKVYKPGRHGFAVRGNPDDPAERKCLEDSLTQVLDWFKRWL